MSRVAASLLPLLLVLVAALPAQQIDKASIERRLAELERSSLAQVEKDAASKAWKEALGFLEQAESSIQRAADFDNQARAAPAMLASVAKDIDAGVPERDPEPPAGATFEQLELLARQAQAAATAAAQEVVTLGAEVERRRKRLAALPDQIARAQSALSKLEESLRDRVRPAADNWAERAAHDLQLARQEALAAEVRSLQAELRSYTARTELLPQRRRLAALRSASAAATAAKWVDLVASERTRQARQVVEDTNRRAQELARYPVIKDYLAASQALAARNEELAKERGDSEKALQEAQSRLDGVQDSFRRIRSRLRTGLNDALGLLLRREQKKLPQTRSLRREARARVHRIADLEYERTLYEDQQQGLPAATAQVDALVEALPEQAPEIRATVARVVAEQRALLDQLVQAYAALTTSLWNLDARSRTLATATDALDTYIGQHVLWVRSIAKGRWPAPSAVWESVQRFADPVEWSALLAASSNRSVTDWALLLLLAGVAIGLLLVGGRLRRGIRERSELAAKQATDGFGLTLGVIWRTVALAIPLPLVVAGLGWFARGGRGTTDFGLAIGLALEGAAALLVPFCIIRKGLQKKGLFPVHLRWPKDACAAIRGQLGWFVPVAVASHLLVVLFAENTAADESLGRAAFIAGSLALSFVLYCLLHPGRAVLGDYLRKHRASWLGRSRWLWFPIVTILPAVLAGAAALGYYYTARQIDSLLYRTLWFLLGLVFVHALFLRWWFIKRRQMAVDQAGLSVRPGAADEESNEDDREAPPHVREGVFDLPGLHQQARQLLRAALSFGLFVGLYLIWADALPALRILERVQVWPRVTVVAARESAAPSWSGLAADAKGERRAASNAAAAPVRTPGKPSRPGLPLAAEQQEPAAASSHKVTLADIGLAVILVLVTTALARNLPSLLEISLLQRLPLDAGARYALTALSRYVIVVLGTLFTFAALGIGWSQVQWLVAALTFGLAFGLQEIFANFMSGLIILAERPMRVGDLVTVGSVHGYVSRIRMRATTITDFDRKELLVPNKDFITGQLVNWTLTDSITRVKVPVGIAYGSDTAVARELLIKIAKECSLVLESPRPKAVFFRFGESSLDFELRVFIDTMDHWPKLMNELHDKIHAEFAAAGIEIAFPQRDLHLRSAEPLAELVDRKRAPEDE